MGRKKPDARVETSKFLSLILRHRPQEIGLTLNSQGWAQLSDLLRCAKRSGFPLTEAMVHDVVAHNDKQRFSFSGDGSCIRANQGHSIPVELGLSSMTPPPILFHGTASRFLASIKSTGLESGKRQHVHLSGDSRTAVDVGRRHGRPVVLHIRAGEMHESGFEFFLSHNGVWLTERVPSDYIDFP